MQVKEIKKEGLSRELEVIVPANEIDKHVETRLKEVGKTVKMDGFRPGKVPLDMLKKRYGRAIMGEVLESAVNDATAQIIKDKKFRPATQPKIEVTDFDEGKDLKYKMEVELLPDFDVMDLKGLKIEKPVAKIENKDIDEALGRITEHHKGSKKIDTDRASKKGDFVVIDFDGRTADDDVHHAGMKAEGHKLELGSGQFIPGFEDQLIGKKVGDDIEVKVSFPENYGAKELAGRDAIFDVKVHEIHEVAPAVVNDDFAKELGFDDEKSLRDAVKFQLSSDFEGQTRLKMKRQLLDILDENHGFDISPKMVETELEAITKQIEMERANDPEAGELKEDEKEELAMIAERRVRLGLVIAEIGQTRNVVVNDQELQRAVISEAQRYPGQEKQIFDFYQKNPQMLENLRAPLFEDKVIDLIFKDAEITEKEVSIDELMSEDDEDTSAKAKKKPAKKAVAKKTDEKAPAKKPAKKAAKKKSA